VKPAFSKTLAHFAVSSETPSVPENRVEMKPTLWCLPHAGQYAMIATLLTFSRLSGKLQLDTSDIISPRRTRRSQRQNTSIYFSAFVSFRVIKATLELSA
jgi:hypothetical protein